MIAEQSQILAMGQPHVPENLSDQKSRGLDDVKTMIFFYLLKLFIQGAVNLISSYLDLKIGISDLQRYPCR